MKTTVEIGSRIEMFVDEWLLEAKSGVGLKLHPPIKKEIVLTLDRPWEGQASGYYSVIQEQDIIRLYYRGYCPDEDNNEEQVTCYAESTDGIHFTRPELGLYEFDGSLQNNIIWRGIISQNFTPFLDRSPNAASHERYKAVGGVGLTSWHTMQNKGDLFALSSEDGIRWHMIREKPVLTDGSFDSQNVAFWDSNHNVYRCYNRYFTDSPDISYRAIQSATSDDFINWGQQTHNQYAERAPLEHFYTNATILCPGVEHMYLSFPMRFIPDRKKVASCDESGVSDAIFMTSRDGVHWDRTFMEGWLRQGLDERNWTHRNGIVSNGCVDMGNEFSFYVSEHFNWPDNRLRRITVRKHGFASVHAGYDGGEFVTRPVIVSGSSLVLNYSTSAAGSILVEIQDESGQPLDGFSLEEAEPLFGDEIEGQVKWGSRLDIGSWNKQPVRFRFVMKDADLFSMRVM